MGTTRKPIRDTRLSDLFPKKKKKKQKKKNSYFKEPPSVIVRKTIIAYKKAYEQAMLETMDISRAIHFKSNSTFASFRSLGFENASEYLIEGSPVSPKFLIKAVSKEAVSKKKIASFLETKKIDYKAIISNLDGQQPNENYKIIVFLDIKMKKITKSITLQDVVFKNVVLRAKKKKFQGISFPTVPSDAKIQVMQDSRNFIKSESLLSNPEPIYVPELDCNFDKHKLLKLRLISGYFNFQDFSKFGNLYEIQMEDTVLYLLDCFTTDVSMDLLADGAGETMHSTFSASYYRTPRPGGSYTALKDLVSHILNKFDLAPKNDVIPFFLFVWFDGVFANFPRSYMKISILIDKELSELYRWIGLLGPESGFLKYGQRLCNDLGEILEQIDLTNNSFQLVKIFPVSDEKARQLTLGIWKQNPCECSTLYSNLEQQPVSTEPYLTLKKRSICWYKLKKEAFELVLILQGYFRAIEEGVVYNPEAGKIIDILKSKTVSKADIKSVISEWQDVFSTVLENKDLKKDFKNITQRCEIEDFFFKCLEKFQVKNKTNDKFRSILGKAPLTRILQAITRHSGCVIWDMGDSDLLPYINAFDPIMHIHTRVFADILNLRMRMLKKNVFVEGKVDDDFIKKVEGLIGSDISTKDQNNLRDKVFSEKDLRTYFSHSNILLDKVIPKFNILPQVMNFYSSTVYKLDIENRAFILQSCGVVVWIIFNFLDQKVLILENIEKNKKNENRKKEGKQGKKLNPSKPLTMSIPWHNFIGHVPFNAFVDFSPYAVRVEQQGEKSLGIERSIPLQRQPGIADYYSFPELVENYKQLEKELIPKKKIEKKSQFMNVDVAGLLVFECIFNKNRKVFFDQIAKMGSSQIFFCQPLQCFWFRFKEDGVPTPVCCDSIEHECKKRYIEKYVWSSFEWVTWVVQVPFEF